MADLAISIAGKLIEVIGNEIIKQICDTWGCESELKDLKETVSTIRDVLLDADHEAARLGLTDQERGYIQNLKDVVYDADDLFDEFLTLAELKQIKTLRRVEKFLEREFGIFSFKKVVEAVRCLAQVRN